MIMQALEKAMTVDIGKKTRKWKRQIINSMKELLSSLLSRKDSSIISQVWN